MISRSSPRWCGGHGSILPACTGSSPSSAYGPTAVGVAREVIGSMRRLADGEHGGDQVIQRPGQVMLSDQDNLVIDAKVVDRPSRNRVVGRRGSQGTYGQVLPRAAPGVSRG